MAHLPGRRFWLAVGVVAIAAFFGLNAYSQRSQFCGSCHSVMGEHYGVDAFDQPGVEAGKVAAYALMGRAGFEERAREIAAAGAGLPRRVL